MTSLHLENVPVVKLLFCIVDHREDAHKSMLSQSSFHFCLWVCHGHMKWPGHPFTDCAEKGGVICLNLNVAHQEDVRFSNKLFVLVSSSHLRNRKIDVELHWGLKLEVVIYAVYFSCLFLSNRRTCQKTILQSNMTYNSKVFSYFVWLVLVLLLLSQQQSVSFVSSSAETKEC